MSQKNALVRNVGLSLLLVIALIGCGGGSYDLEKAESIDVCVNGTCTKAEGHYSKDQLLGGLLTMFKANEGTEAKLCDADPQTLECTHDKIAFYVQGGPVPGVSTYGDLYLSQVGLDRKTFQIKYTMAASVSWIGTPVFCQDTYTELSVNSLKDVYIESPSFACMWAILPHVWSIKYSISKIDFDNSRLSGRYSVAGAGLMVGGGGTGTFAMELVNKKTLASSLEQQTVGAPVEVKALTELPVEIIAGPVPKAEDVVTSNGELTDDEKSAWESASKANTLDALQGYISRYPEGRFAKMAQSKIAFLEEAARQDDELALWAEVKKSGDAASLKTYLTKFPTGLYAEIAKLRIRRFDAAAEEAQALDQELGFWEEVKASTDKGEIELYLKRYPNGQFADLAHQRISRLDAVKAQGNDFESAFWKKIETSSDQKDYQNFLQSFPDGIYSELAKVRLQNLRAVSSQTAELDLWNSVKTSRDPQQFAKYLNSYPQGQFAALAKNLAAQLQQAEQEQAELLAWEEAKLSDKITDYQTYLARFPTGRFVENAKQKVKQLDVYAELSGIDFGTYYALVIGNNDYRFLPQLQTAINDARAIADLLKTGYGFKVTPLINANRKQVIDALSQLRRTLGPHDNLLIYYAGHGWLDQAAERGYWLPIDAERDSPANWISTTDITDTLKAMQAKHVIVVADSCYSGTLSRDVKLTVREPDYLKRLVDKKTRVAMTSGGLEPVMDSGGGSHSVFASAFITALEKNSTILAGVDLFSEVRRPVITNAPQTPEYSDIRFAGHEGGDFIFVRQSRP